MKHHIKDQSLFGIDIIDVLVAEHLQLEVGGAEFQNFVVDIDAIGCLGPVIDNRIQNQHDELVPMWIQNSWRVCIDYKKLNQATRKHHFPLPFQHQVLEKLAGKYMQIHIALEDQHKTTFTCPFGTFAYICMPFGLCNTSSTFQRYMTSIFLDLLQDCMEVFMDDFTVYSESFDASLENLS
ncbi:hypothetical protein CR513_12730, partial [Mucuna pruriens]